MYKRPEHYKDIVLRCPNHKNSSKDGKWFILSLSSFTSTAGVVVISTYIKFRKI